MFLKKIPVGKLLTNCYIVADDDGNGVIIDPGDHADTILEIAHHNNIHVDAVWLTHGHFDHMLAVQDIIESTHAKLYISEKDADCLTNPEKNLLSYVHPNLLLNLQATKTLKECDVVYAGSIPFTVWETPGHTPGSICFANDKEFILFTGDTLFAEGGFGRTDLPGGDENAIQESLKRLSTISESYHIYPGHGNDFVMGDLL